MGIPFSYNKCLIPSKSKFFISNLEVKQGCSAKKRSVGTYGVEIYIFQSG